MLTYRFNGVKIMPWFEDERFTGHLIFVPPETWTEQTAKTWQDLSAVTWGHLNCYEVE